MLKGKTAKRSGFRCLAAAMMLMLIALLVCLIFYYRATASRVFTVTGHGSGDGPKSISLTGSVTKRWKESGRYDEGGQYDFAVKNNSYNDIYGWEAVITLNSDFYIDSSWNGSVSSGDRSITVKPADYNKTVKSAEQQTFGMVLHTVGKAEVTGYKVSYMRNVKLNESPWFWAIVVLMGMVAVVTVTTEINDIKYFRLKKREKEKQEILDQSFRTFAKIIDAKDPYTKGHSVRVAYYSRELASDMGLSEDEQQRIFYIGLLHDIGKIGVTDQILNKPGRLTNFEREVIQTHVEVGGDILKDFTSIPEISDGARYHHERWDGKGYASHISGEDIPLFARIICVADSYDAMSSVRCYRGSLTPAQILSELKLCSGSQFDPEIVKHMISLIEQGKAPITVEQFMRSCP